MRRTTSTKWGSCIVTDETFYTLKCGVWIALAFCAWAVLFFLTWVAWRAIDQLAGWIAG